MAGGLFDKAITAWNAVFGTDEFRDMLDDERSELSMLQQQTIDLRWKVNTLESLLAARDAEIAALRQQLAERNGDTVRQQYTDVDAWQEATGDMVQ